MLDRREHLADRHAPHAGNRGEGCQHHEFPPQIEVDVGRNGRLDAGHPTQDESQALCAVLIRRARRARRKRQNGDLCTISPGAIRNELM